MVPDSRDTYTIVSQQFIEYMKTCQYEKSQNLLFWVPRLCVKDAGIKVKFEMNPTQLELNFLPTVKAFSEASRVLKGNICLISEHHTVRFFKERILRLINYKLYLNYILSYFATHEDPSENPYVLLNKKLVGDSVTKPNIPLRKFDYDDFRLWIMYKTTSQDGYELKRDYFEDVDTKLFNLVNSQEVMCKPEGICLENFGEVQVKHILEWLGTETKDNKTIYVEIKGTTLITFYLLTF